MERQNLTVLTFSVSGLVSKGDGLSNVGYMFRQIRTRNTELGRPYLYRIQLSIDTAHFRLRQLGIDTF